MSEHNAETVLNIHNPEDRARLRELANAILDADAHGRLHPAVRSLCVTDVAQALLNYLPRMCVQCRQAETQHGRALCDYCYTTSMEEQ